MDLCLECKTVSTSLSVTNLDLFYNLGNGIPLPVILSRAFELPSLSIILEWNSAALAIYHPSSFSSPLSSFLPRVQVRQHLEKIN